jgi:glutamate-ammonia-ligase adenylyltransferase
LGQADPLEVAQGYARVAEAAIQVLAGAATAEFARRHGTVPGSDLLILGLGRIGGAELTHASDLDLIYLFSGTHGGQSDGERPLRTTDYFNRLAPRISAALSVATAAGPLYEVDLRLRPSGRDGLLAVSLESFADYQRTCAWTFEHMALTRARPVFGPPAAHAELTATVADLLRLPRDAAKGRRRRRSDARRDRAPQAGGGTLRHQAGGRGVGRPGILVQTLQLTHGVGLTPRLDEAIAALVAAGLLPDELIEAHRLLTRMLVTLRLVSPAAAEPPPASRRLVAAACAHQDWDSLLAAHAAARQSIARHWRAVAAGGRK